MTSPVPFIILAYLIFSYSVVYAAIKYAFPRNNNEQFAGLLFIIWMFSPVPIIVVYALCVLSSPLFEKCGKMFFTGDK